MGWLKREAIVDGGVIEEEETQVYIMGSSILVSYPTPIG